MLSATREAARELMGVLEVARPRRILVFLGCLLVAAAAYGLTGDAANLSEAGRRALFAVVLSAGLWVTEAIPAFAVSVLVIGLGVLLLGKPGGAFAETASDWEGFVTVLGSPLIWLFFGGFVLAAGVAKAGLSRQLADAMLRASGTGKNRVLLGAMLLTFSLSMFMSNTATTVMLLAVLAPIITAENASDATTGTKKGFGKALLLGVAVAANLGGMGSLIGTPPNAIAVGLLAPMPGGNITFGGWMLFGLPPALLLMALMYLLLRVWYQTGGQIAAREPDAPSELKVSLQRWQRMTVVGTSLVTIGLWMTGGFHGIPTAAVSFLPIVMLTMSGVIGAADIRTLSWDVLLLLAGGLSLGYMVSATGLAQWLVGAVPGGLTTYLVAFVLAYGTVVVSNLMSNTAAANILIPLSIALAPTAAPQLVIPIALAASTAMCLPISTPPNAIAYAHGGLRSRDLLRAGLVTAAAGPAIAVVWVSFVLNWL